MSLAPLDKVSPSWNFRVMTLLGGTDLTMNLIGISQTAPGASLDKLFLSHTSREVIKEENNSCVLAFLGWEGYFSRLVIRGARLCSWQLTPESQHVMRAPKWVS